MPGPVFVNSRGPIVVQAERMGAIEQRLQKIDRQIATSDRLADPADDPSGTNRAALLAREDARLVADGKAIARAVSRLEASETAIGTATDALMRARELALLAANGTQSAEDREAIAKELEVLRTQLFEAANVRDESGRYLFAGSRGNSPAFEMAPDGTVLWAGQGVAAGAEAAGLSGLGPPRGVDLFGPDGASAFAHLAALATAVRLPDDAARSAALAEALGGLEADSNRLIEGQSLVGTSLARLELEDGRVADSRLANAEALAKVRGVDLTAAYAELSALQLTLSAAQGSFARLYDGSLFDRLG